VAFLTGQCEDVTVTIGLVNLNFAPLSCTDAGASCITITYSGADNHNIASSVFPNSELVVLRVVTIHPAAA
jgi:hypothetical protein